MTKKPLKIHATPYIALSYLEHKHWKGHSFKEVAKTLNQMEEQIKDSVSYPWGNSHIYIQNIYGELTLKVMFSKTFFTKNCYNIFFWNAKTGDALPGFYGEYFTQKHIEKINNLIKGVTEDKRLCNNCEKWVTEGKSYGFVGFVCNECFDPEIHLNPDTSGD